MEMAIFAWFLGMHLIGIDYGCTSLQSANPIIISIRPTNLAHVQVTFIRIYFVT